MVEKRIPGLLYHRIGHDYLDGEHGLTISPGKFEMQIDWLVKRGYVGIRASDWIRWTQGHVELPEKPILITFDDAYEDIDTNALPILQKYGYGATVFVVTEQVGGMNSWDVEMGFAPLPLMNLKQIRYWAERGIEFGAHSRTHADLTTLSQTACNEEVEGSKKELSAMLNSEVRSFAYPYGKFNASVQRSVSENFDVAFGVQEGMNSLSTDPHSLNRIYVGPTLSMLEFALGVHRGKLEPFLTWRSRLRIRSRFGWVRRKLLLKGGV